MEVTFTVVKPNLYVCSKKESTSRENEIYFSTTMDNLVSVGRNVDDVALRHTGRLRVGKAVYDILKSGETKEEEPYYTTALCDYLDELEKRLSSKPRVTLLGFSTPETYLLGAGHLLIDAKNVPQGPREIATWQDLEKTLSNPQEVFDAFEKKDGYTRLDRERTLEEIRKLRQELEPGIPNVYTRFLVLPAEVEARRGLVVVGRVCFEQMKKTERPIIEEVTSELVEKLKEFPGPTLSYDAPSIMQQAINLFVDAGHLVTRYGDVLTNPNWPERLLKIDPCSGG